MIQEDVQLSRFSGLRLANRLPSKSKEEAESYISTYSSRGGPAIGVEYYLTKPRTARQESKLEKLRQKIMEAQENYEQRKKVIEDKFFYNTKSHYVSCKKCSSRLSKQYLRTFVKGMTCPVCGKSIMTDNNLKSLKRFEDKVSAAGGKYHQGEQDIAKKQITRNTAWVIGGKV